MSTFSANDVPATDEQPHEPTLSDLVTGDYGKKSKGPAFGAKDIPVAEPADIARSHLILSGGSNPEQTAQSVQVSRQLGVPQPAVEADLPGYQQAAQVQSNLDAVQNSPRTQQWLAQSPVNAKLASDQIEHLTGIEGMLTALGHSFALSANRQWQGLKAMAADFKQSLSPLSMPLKAGFSSDSYQQLQQLREQSPDWQKNQAALHEAMQDTQTANLIQAQERPKFDSKAADWTYSGVEGLVNATPALLAATVNPALTVGMFGGQAQAEGYGKYRARGATSGQALGGSLAEGTVMAASGALPLGYVVNSMGKVGVGKFFANLLGRDVASMEVQTLANSAIDTAVANPDKTWSDWASELPENMGQAATAALVFSGTMGAVHGTVRTAQAMDARHAAAVELRDKLGQISQKVGETRAATADPEGFKDFLDTVAEDGNLKDVYVDAPAFLQAMQEHKVSLDQLKQVAPDTASQLLQSAGSGTAIKIHTADYLTGLKSIQGGKFADGLLDHLKADPDSSSFAEAKQFEAGQAQQMQEAVQEAVKKDTAGAEWAKSSQAVKDDIARQLEQVGLFHPEVAKTYADTRGRLFTELAKRLGKTPQEVYEAYGAKIVRDEAQQLKAYSQTDMQRRKGPDSTTVDPDRAWQEHQQKLADKHQLRAEQVKELTLKGERDTLTGLYADSELLPALRRAQASGKQYHYSEADTFNMSGMNSHLGANARTDAVLKQIGAEYAKAFKGATVFRRGAGRFAAITPEGFDVAGAEKKVAQAAQRIAKEHGLAEIKAPRASNAKGIGLYSSHNRIDSGAHPEHTIGQVQERIKAAMPQEVQDVNGSKAIETWFDSSGGQARRVAERAGSNREQGQGQGERGREETAAAISALERASKRTVSNAGRFLDPEAHRTQEYSDLADRLDLSAEARKDFHPTTARDGLTGWFTARDLEPTLKRAQALAEKDGTQSTYVVADISNLGGMNKALGKDVADAIFRNMAEIVHEHAGGDQLDVVPFRHGGDEVSFLIVGADRDVAQAAMDKATAEVQRYVKAVGIEGLPHAKYLDNPDKAGSGVYVGMSKLGDTRDSLHDIMEHADAEVELAKKSAKPVAMGEPMKLQEAGRFNQSAYHGSPYKFDKFTLDHMGKGEGAQAYGWGLYFAGNKEVAEYYRKALSDIELRVNGGEFDNNDPAHRAAAHVYEAEKNGNTRQDVIDRLKRSADDLESRGKQWASDEAALQRKEIELLNSDKPLPKYEEKSGGQLYEADIPNDENMLDWDKPLSEQSDIVKKALGIETRDFAAEDALFQRAKEEGKQAADYPEYKELEKKMDAVSSAGRESAEMLYHRLVRELGGDEAASKYLHSLGIQGIRYLDASSRSKPYEVVISTSKGEYARNQFDTKQSAEAYADEKRSEGFTTKVQDNEAANHNYVVFDDKAIDILKTYYQKEDQVSRGFYSPTARLLGLSKHANLSSFIHETGHEALDIYSKIAALPDAPAELQADVGKIMDWLGVKSLDEWRGMSMEQQRPYHEQFARGMEAYFMEGKAPTVELTKPFQRIKAWMLNIYQSLKNLNVELTDEVRSVFDRMYASEEAIKSAEEIRGYTALFAERPKGVSKEDWDSYQALGEAATQKAIAEMQARSIKDMKWLSNAKSRALRELQKQANEQRREVRIDARRDVLSQPVYQAWSFLTRKDVNTYKAEAEQRSKELDISRDSLLEAIAKLGGVSQEEVKATWGVAAKDVKSGIFGKPVLRKDGGRSLDEMATVLGEQGYLKRDEHGKVDLHEFEDRFAAEVFGDKQYSDHADYDRIQGESPEVDVRQYDAGKLDVAELREAGKELGADVSDRLEKLGMASKDGLPLDLVADRFGYESATGLLLDLAKAELPKDAIEKLTDQYMLERHGELATPKGIEDAANQAIHNEVRAKFMAAGLKILTKTSLSSSKIAKGAREYAEQVIGEMKVSDVDPRKYEAAEAKYYAEAVKLAAKEPQKAISAQRNALLNNQLARVAREVKDGIKQDIDYFKKLEGKAAQGKMRGEFLAQLNGLLGRFDLRSMVPKEENRKPIAQWVQEESERLSAVAPDLPEWITNDAYRTHYTELTTNQMRDLKDSVKQLEFLARREHKQYQAIRNMEFGEERGAVLAEIKQAWPKAFSDEGLPKEIEPDFVPSLTKARKTLGAKFAGEFLNAENLLSIMGGGKFTTVNESLFGRMSKQSDWKASRMETIYKQLKPLFDQYSRKEKYAFGRKDVTTKAGIDVAMTRENALVVALLHGNKEGRERLANYGWDEAKQKQIIAVLDERDMKLADGIWRLFDENLWPELQALNDRTRGKAPPKVEALPFDTAHGKARGGYFRLKYDTTLDERAHHFDETQAVKDLLGGSLGMSSKTNQGTSMERKQNVKLRPRLDLGVFSEAVNETVHDLAYREAVADTMRMLNDKQIQLAVKNVVGNEGYHALVNRVREVAAPPRSPSGFIEKTLSIARRNTVITLMSGVKTALQNFTGLAPAFAELNAGTLSAEVAKFYSNKMLERYDFAMQHSEYMRRRFTSYDRDLQDMASKLTVNGKLMPDASTWLALMGIVDKGVAVPVWNAAFKQGMERFANDTQKAVDYADHTVRSTQGSGREVDLPSIMSGHGGYGQLKRAFTMFYSYFNGQLNLLVKHGVITRIEAREHPQQAVAKFTGRFIAIVVLPAILTEMLMHGVVQQDEEGDPDKLASRYAGSLVKYGAGFFPLARDMVPSIWGTLVDQDARHYAPKISPLDSAYEGMSKGAQSLLDLYHGENDEKDTKNLIMAAGFGLGLPGKLVSDTTEGTRLWLNDEAGPEAIVLGPSPKQ